VENLVNKGRNGGRLKAGNPMPGGWPGGGRPKDEIRALCASNLAKAAELIQKKLADDPDLTNEQAIKAADVSGKYSLGTNAETETRVIDDKILESVAETVSDLYGEDKVMEFMSHLKEKREVK